MIDIRKLEERDIPDLQRAIDNDTFHPGEWKINHFLSTPGNPVTTNVISDEAGPIAFVRYTKSLRISCVWDDAADTSRNARAIIQGIRDAVEKARASGFSEIIITTTHPKLAAFFERILKMTKSDGEFLLAV